MDPITGIAILDWLLGFLDTAGYRLVFGITVVENIFVVGSFTPGETVVLAAAFLSTPQFGTLSWPFVWLSSVSGTVIGSNISYYLGRKGGREALFRYGHRFRISERRIAEAEAYFDRYGSKTVLIARFTAGFKNFVPMIAGASKMKLPWFEAYTFLGAALYTSIIVAIGYFIGENFDEALRAVSRVTNVGLALAAAAVVVVVFAWRRARRRWAAEDAEEAKRVAEAFEREGVEHTGSIDGILRRAGDAERRSDDHEAGA